MAQVKFAYGTKARYDALAPKDMDTLYFTTDTLQLFKGTTEYTKSTKMVSSLPAAGQVQGIIYFRMTDYTMHIWNGVEFVQLNKTTVTQIPADATNDDIPTTKAVADYVNAKVAAVEGIKGKFVTDVTYNAGVLSVAKGDEPVTTTMTGIVHEPTYDAETRTIKLPVFGGDTLTIALGKDLVVKSGIYNTETHEIELTITTGEVIKIPVGSLIDIYIGVATSTATVTVSDDNKISVDVRVSAKANNSITIEEDGLYVAVPDAYTKSETDAKIKKVQDQLDGHSKDAVVHITAEERKAWNARLDVNKGAWVDKSITFLISQDFSGGGYGICRLVYRSNADSGSASVDAQWLVRRGFSADTIQVAIKTDKTNGAYCDAFYKSSGTYMGVVIRAIASGGRATSGRTWTLVDSNEVGGTTATDKKTSSECWKTIADAGTALHKQAYSASAPAKDEGYVASAGSANTSSSCAGNSASATKLTSSAGSATQPVYFKDGKPVAGTYTLGDASSKTVRTLGAVGNTGWANKTTDDKYIPTMSFMAYWNGAYSGTSSNLQYCDRGRFGTIVTKGSGDYAAAGHTHNYAGSGSAGGSANSAVKLDSNAGSSVQPVYFSGGKPVAIGYTISSSVPANAKFTDTTYGVASSSSNGLMSSTDKTKLDDFSRVISIQKQIKLTTDWLDTGIAGNSLDTGTYVVQVSGFNSSYTQLYSEIYSGVMSWYSGTTNSGNSSEIFLHNAGLADNNNAIYLRTLRVAGSKTLKLQIACKVAATGTDILTFKFRRLI